MRLLFQTVGLLSLLALQPPAPRRAVVSLIDFPGVDPTGAADSSSGLQAAVSSGAPSLFCPPGSVFRLRSTVKIAGVRLYSGAFAACRFTVPAGVDAFAPASDVIFDGIEVSGGGGLGPTHDCGSTGGCAFNAHLDATGIALRNSYIHDFGGHCFNSGGANRVTVENNVFARCKDDGVLLIGTTGPSLVSNNWFLSVGSNSVDINMPLVQVRSNHIFHSGYQLTGTDFYAILVAAANVPGIGVISPDNVDISNNEIVGTHGPAIDIRAEVGHTDNARVHGNHIVGAEYNARPTSLQFGILIDSSVGPSCVGTVNAARIESNVIDSTFYGIDIGGGSFCRITNAEITLNTVTRSAHSGIVAVYGSGHSVSLNTVRGSGVADVLVQRGAGNAFCNYAAASVCGLLNATQWRYSGYLRQAFTALSR